MAQVNTTELAKALDVTKGRISQLVASGQLDGCYTGAGRARRFDLAACAKALNRRLDPGQMMGNGAQTKARLREIEAGAPGDDVPETTGTRKAAREQKSEGGALPLGDPDRYELARIQKAEEEARKLRRQNLEAEGTFVLAAEAQRQIARRIGQEIAEFETMLRDGARRIADTLEVDYREARAVLLQVWRDHRKGRAGALSAEADADNMTDEEKQSDV